MTRPMPGPPDTLPPVHDLSRPPVGPDGQDDWETWRRWKEQDAREWRTIQDKHLTMEGCAAHYWQAKSALGSIEAVLVSPALLKSRIRVWDRFTNTPHALEAGR